LRGEKETCLTALEISKGKGSLPIPEDIQNDPDLVNVKDQDWFVAFMESLKQEPEVVVVKAITKGKTESLIKDDAPAMTESEIINEPVAQSDENDPVSEKNNEKACLAVEDFK